MRLVRRRPLEVYISTLCAAHLVLLLLLLALLPSDALPPAHLLGSERPQQFAGLLALAALVARSCAALEAGNNDFVEVMLTITTMIMIIL